MRKSGFTLIEMIAVLLILALLAAALTGGLATAREKAWRTQARETCRNICGAWNAYLIDARKFPANVPKNGKDVEATYDNMKWIVDSSQNRFSRTYLEITEKEKEKGVGLRDHWDQLFLFSLDMDYDGQVDNPYPDPDSELLASEIKATSIAWSVGNPKGHTAKNPANAIVAW